MFLSLFECYKIAFGMNKLNFDDLFEFAKYNSTRANHPYKLYFKPAKCNPYKYSFPIRIVLDWNRLPGSIVEAGSQSRFTEECAEALRKYPLVVCLVHLQCIVIIDPL